METVADRLKFAREYKRLTQSQLAINSGVSTGTIGNIESGARRSKGSIPQIAEALGVCYKWLERGDGEMLPPSSSAIATTQSRPVQPVGREPNLPKFPDGEICKESRVYSLLSTLSEELQYVDPAQRKAVAGLLDALANNPYSTSLVAALTALIEPLPEQIPKKKAHA